MSRESYADILAAWRAKNPLEADADKRAMQVQRDSRRSVRVAAEELADDDPDGHEEYGVAAMCDDHPHHHMPMRAYDPCEDDSDFEDERAPAVRTLSWDDPTSTMGARVEGVVCLAKHAMPTSGDATMGAPNLPIMLDSGASIHLFQTEAMRGAATQLEAGASMGYINGIGGRSPVTAMLGVRLRLKGGASIVLKAPFAKAPDAAGATAVDILSTAKLFDDTGIITMLDPEPHLRMPEPSLTRVPLQRRGRYYMLDALVTPLHGAMIASVCAASRATDVDAAPPGVQGRVLVDAASTSLDENDMWAARLCLSSRGLKKLVQATIGTGVKSVTHRMASLADACTFRAASVLRRKPVPRGHTREFLPGQCFEYDVWGPAGAASVNGGEAYDLHAVCVATGYGHAIKTRNHKARTVIDFISDMVAAERAFGHTVMIVRMDRAPEHESDELRSGMRALGVVLELTPRYHLSLIHI